MKAIVLSFVVGFFFLLKLRSFSYLTVILSIEAILTLHEVFSWLYITRFWCSKSNSRKKKCFFPCWLYYFCWNILYKIIIFCTFVFNLSWSEDEVQVPPIRKLLVVWKKHEALLKSFATWKIPHKSYSYFK